MRRQLSPEQRQTQIMAAIRDYGFWRPTDIMRYIKAKTGIGVKHETIKKDIEKIKRTDENLFHDIALGGSVHIIGETITQLNQEIASMKDDAERLKVYDDMPADKRLDSIYKQLRANPEFADLADKIQAAVAHLTISSTAGKRAWILGEIDKKRLVLLEIMEAYPIHHAVKTRLDRQEQNTPTQ